MKLRRILEQQDAAAQYYDLGKDFSAFTQTMDRATEEVKNRFEQAIATKLKGKKIRARASRGYKQFEKDYEIDVSTVSIDDYYDNYVVVVRGNNNKEYFLKPGFKIQIIGAAEEPKQDQPAQTPPAPQPQQQQQSPAPQASTAQPTEPPQQPVKENTEGHELVHPYSIERIEQDIANWLPNLLSKTGFSFKPYIPKAGVTRTKERQMVAVYAIIIPVEEAPGLTAEHVRAELSGVSGASGDGGGFNNTYTLDKFDVKGDRYIIIVKKTTNY